jgi:hypothetical protein
MAEAQLMCWKPSTKGLVYPRFEGTINEGNVITIEKAWETLVGDQREHVSNDDLILQMRTTGIRFFAGVDWGYTHDFVIVVFAMIPNGEVWVVDCYSTAGLEFSDQLEAAKLYRDRYQPERWFCDQNMPSSIKSFTKNGMKSPSFTKDVMGGIEALRSKIVDGYGRRLLKILHTEPNQKVINAFTKHHFKIGPDGNPTLEPDDTPGVADQADAMRYVAQNMFPVKGTQKVNQAWTDGYVNSPNSLPNPSAEQQMKEEIYKRIGEAPIGITSGKKGGFHFTF